MNTCDLHSHSTFSDGTFTPTQIVGEALRKELRAVALTDHNTITGIPEFLEAAAETSLEAIPGVEITTCFLGRELHILGLFLEEAHWEELEDFLRAINQRKEKSNLHLIASLNRAGYELRYDEILERHRGNINRAVIASEMLKKGYVQSIEAAFRGVLSVRAGHYIPAQQVHAFDTIRLLRSIHTVPVLAHPFVSMSEEALYAFLPEAKALGLAAMETQYSTYTPETAAMARAVAREFSLLESGGSDFHGQNKPSIHLGTGTGSLEVPYSFAERLCLWNK